MKEVINFLEYFDDSYTPSLHENVDIYRHGEKLSKFAHFLIASDGNERTGFIAYYLNEAGRFVYISQIAVHKDCRHNGIGHRMLSVLQESFYDEFNEIQLEVFKGNDSARKFYNREGFRIIEDHNEKFFLKKEIIAVH